MTVEAKQQATLQTWKPGKKREVNYFDLFVKKHRNVFEDSHIFIQFCPKEPGYSWSGPICVSSIGRFFLKFRRSEGMVADGIKRDRLNAGKPKLFASVDVVQETASFVLHFTKPPKVALPYRIENYLSESSIMYFQKVQILFLALLFYYIRESIIVMIVLIHILICSRIQLIQMYYALKSQNNMLGMI